MEPTLQQAWAAVKGNGCSDVPDFTAAFTKCCNRHDADYTTASDELGNKVTRTQADARLYQCLKCASTTLIGKYAIAPLYWIGVRLFGHSHWGRK